MNKPVKNEIIDILSLCRLCLSRQGVSIDIFESSNNVSLPMRIMACASLEVSSSDSLPKRICTECRYQLEKSYVFRKRCKITDTKLRRHLKLINAGKESDLFCTSDDEDDDEFAESYDFFNFHEDEQNKKLEEENKQRELEFEERMKNFMEEVRKQYATVVPNRKMEKTTKIKQKKDHSTIENDTELTIETINSNNEKETNIIKTNESNTKVDLLIEELTNSESHENLNINECSLNSNKNLEMEHEEIEEVLEEDSLALQQINSNDHTDDDLQEMQLTNKSSIEEVDTQNFIINKNFVVSSDDEDQISFSFQDDEETFVLSSKKIKKDETDQLYLKKDENFDEENEIETYESIDFDTTDSSMLNLYDKLTDDEFNMVTKAIRSTLIKQVGITEDTGISYKLLKCVEGIAKVEVELNDGTNYVMEVELPNRKFIRTYKCNKCDKTFNKNVAFHKHLTMHNKDKGKICNQCGKWFPSKSAHNRHYRTHTGERPFKCEICNRSFIQKEILKRHMVVHTGEKPYACTECEMKFTQADILRQHMNRKHSTTPIIPVYPCTICNRKFSYPSGLSRHSLIHSGKTYVCPVCNRPFTDKSSLKRHRTIVHKDVKSE